jgi:chemotaxis signal transduction protein
VSAPGVHVHLRLGREAYAIPVEHVVEVVELGDLAPLPGAGPHVLGLRHLRGQVLPVFDLAALLGAGESEPARVCVAVHERRAAGLAIDEVTDVAGLPDGGSDVDAPLLTSSTLVDGRLVGLIDAGALFAELERRGGR